MKKTSVKIVAVVEEKDKPCWPCINHDDAKELERVTKPIIENNIDMVFNVVTYTHLSQAEADYEADLKKYDGVLVLLMTCWKGIDRFYAAQSKDGIPTIIADIPFCGSGSALISASPFIRKNNLPVPLMSTMDYAELAEAVRIFDVFAKMKQTNILVITENEKKEKEAEAYAALWGCNFVFKSNAAFMEYMQKATDEEAEAIAARWSAEAVEILEATSEDIVEGAKVHIALREMMKDTQTQAVTVDCLSLSYSGAYGENRHFYPCLSHFEMLNNGVVAVCEADLRSTVTSLVVYYLTGKQGYVSDPAIDTSSDRIIYAHCVGCKKVYGCDDARTCRYTIRSHAEDKKGAAVQIFFPAGDDLTTVIAYHNRAQIHSAKAVGNVGYQEGCRSKLAAQTDTETILNNWDGGWHRVTVFGDYRKQLMRLFKAKGLPVIEEDKN
ncbi:MAG: hypothetical protein IJA60_02460 [Clostridia bacterium]|nr:hypothetical protein [Clostridia bacterium]